MIHTTIQQAAEWLQAPVFEESSQGAQCAPEQTLFTGVCTDSRKVQPGMLYIPLIGKRTDGHQYIEQVKEAGAAAAFWQKDYVPYPRDLPLILTDNNEKALGELARKYLETLNCVTIGITGSNGKTSAKDLLFSILSLHHKAHKTAGNMNSEIGMPLTILDLDPDVEYNILEMGMENPGEIAELCAIAPLDLALITSIGSAHLENLGSRENIARAKLEILDGVRPGGTFVWNADSPELQNVLPEKTPADGVTLLSFGEGGDGRLTSDVRYTRKGISFTTNLLSAPVTLPAAGDFQAMNALGVILLAQALGMEEEEILQGLASAELTPMRGAIFQAGEATILDDTYKSNPESARAAVDMLMKVEGDRHIAVLADMWDLGEEEELLHQQVGEYAREAGVDLLFTYGEKSEATARGFGQGAQSFSSKEELVKALAPFLEQRNVLMVKGSRIMAMDTVVKDLLEEKKMTTKTKLGVVFGGQSSEYSVSLHSAASFLRQIHRDLYDLTLIGIDQQGRTWIVEDDIDAIEHDHWKDNAREAAWVHHGIQPLDGTDRIELDVVFPILHGKNGEDGCFQGMMEMKNIRYVGCDTLGSAMCMDKEIMHILLKAAGIGAADYICLKKNEPMPSFEDIEKKIPLPWIVKPCNAGSSYGVNFVDNKEDFEKAVEEAFKYDGRGKILVEKTIEGFEIGCAVMGNDELFAGSVDEIETGAHFFDFEGKYAMKDSNIYCPARIPAEKIEEARELAKKAYRVMNCRGMARVDMFYQPDGTIVINELNTIPGFTATSRYPTMMKEAGLDFPELIDRLVALGLQTEVGVC